MHFTPSVQGASRVSRLLALGLVASALTVTAAFNGSSGASAGPARSDDTELAAAPACVSNKLGLPARGTAYAGTTASGGVSLSAREKYYGRTAPIHRSYWGPSQVASAARAAATDVANNRVPWVSFKVSGTWKQNADGKYDAWARSVIQQMNAVNGPVWLAFYHEPESKNQDVREWTRMQARFARMVQSSSDNIAMTIIVMGYHQVLGSNPAYKLEKLWPGDGLIDVLGMDPYNFYGWKSSGKVNKTMTDLRPWFAFFDKFAKAHKTRWGVAEIGYTHEAAAKDPAWLSKTYDQLMAAGGVAMSYFDTTLNTGGYSWNLDPTVKRDVQRRNVRTSVQIC